MLEMGLIPAGHDTPFRQIWQVRDRVRFGGPAWYRLVCDRTGRGHWTFVRYFGLVSVITFLFPDWVFNFDQPTDGPAYLSFMLDYVGQMRRFSDQAISGLLPALLPVHLFHVVFPPLLAHVLYKILLVSALLLLQHLAAVRLFGRGYGVVAATLVGANGFFFLCHGSDYVEASAMFYLGLTVYLVVRSSADRRRLWAFLLGAACVCLVSSALLSVAYLPGLGLMYLLLKRKYGRPWLEWSDAWVAAGAAGCFALFCSIYRVLVGKWFYMAIALQKASGFLAMNRTPGPPSVWLPTATWLFPCIIVCAYTLQHLGSVVPKASLRAGRGRLRLGTTESLAVATLISASLLSYLQLVRQQGTISDRFYYNQLIPLVSLSLVGILHREFGPKFGNWRAALFVGGIAAVWFENTAHAVTATNLLWFCLAMLTVSVLTRNVSRLAHAAMATSCWLGLVALSASLWPMWAAGSAAHPVEAFYINPKGVQVRIRSLRHEVFAQIVDWMKIVNQLDRNGAAWMWFNALEPLGRQFYYFNFASHLFQARLINEHYPQVDVPDNDWHGPMHHKAAPGMEALIPTASGTQSLTALAENLQKHGMRFELIEQRPFVSGRLSFEVFHIRILAL